MAAAAGLKFDDGTGMRSWALQGDIAGNVKQLISFTDDPNAVRRLLAEQQAKADAAKEARAAVAQNREAEEQRHGQIVNQYFTPTTAVSGNPALQEQFSANFTQARMSGPLSRG